MVTIHFVRPYPSLLTLYVQCTKPPSLQKVASNWAYICSIIRGNSNHSLRPSIPKFTDLICSVHQDPSHQKVASIWAYVCSRLRGHSNHSLCPSVPKFTYVKVWVSNKILVPPPWQSVTEHWRYLNAYNDNNQWFKWYAFILRSIENWFFCGILGHQECIVCNVNDLSQNFMKYCLNIIHYQFTTGSRGLKLFNVSAILATIWCLVVYLSEYVKIFFLRPLLKILVLIECLLCYLSGILDKVYLSLLTKFHSKSQVLMVCTNLLGYYN